MHAHQGSSAYLDAGIARKSGFKTIAHSHNTYTNRFFDIKEFLFKCVSYKTRYVCDAYIGCSKAALFSRYGKNISKRKTCYILNNGVDINKYSYSNDKRRKIRDEYDIHKDKKVFLFVGRFTEIKNPYFAINVFRNYHNFNNDSVLFMAGIGPIKKQVDEYICNNNLSQFIRTLGNVDNIDEFLSASDYLLMPSLKEGFPVALVEAQCSNILCLVSDKITPEVKLTNNLHFLPIHHKKSVSIWVKKILATDITRSREQINLQIVQKFSDASTIENISSIYLKLIS